MCNLVQLQHQPAADKTVGLSLFNIESRPVKGPQSNVHHNKMAFKLEHYHKAQQRQRVDNSLWLI